MYIPRVTATFIARMNYQEGILLFILTNYLLIDHKK